MPTIEITHASDSCREPWSRRSLIRSGLAGLLAPALVAIAVPARAQQASSNLLRDAYHSIEDARAIGLSYLQAMPHEASAETLSHALFGESLPASRRELRERLAAARDSDFSEGRVLAVRGWLMAVTEARWCALAVFLGDSA